MAKQAATRAKNNINVIIKIMVLINAVKIFELSLSFNSLNKAF